MKIKKIAVFLILFSITFAFSSCSGAGKVQEASSFAMGSVVSVKTYSNNSQAGQSVCDEITAEISRFDKVISKNDKSAELYSANQSLASGVKVSRELFDVVESTKELFSLSGKKAAVTSGALTELWGFDTDNFNVPSDGEIKSAIPFCDDSTLELDRSTLTIKAKQGQILNLGAVGKGAACDKAVDLLLSHEEIKGAIVSLGGSLALYGKPSGKDNFTIGIRNPFGEVNDTFATLKLGSCFVSTSGNYEKTFEKDGVTYHHLLNLTTGKPADNGLCSVTVVAHSGLESDALSTVCFVLGEAASYPILQKYNAEAVFVYSDKTVSVSDGLQDSFTLTDKDFTVE